MDTRAARIKSLALFDAMGYPPTAAELDSLSVPAPVESPMIETCGRVTFEGREALVEEHESREFFFPRKLRRARQVTRILARLSGVRFVALCNTTALSHARDEADLDFFVITRNGSITQVRGWATLFFKLFGKRPGTGSSDRDAICLSYFVDDSALDLTSHMLPNGDPYFEMWFLSLLPLFDDGVSSEFWKANATIRVNHPNARPWIMSEDIRIPVPTLRWPTPPSFDGLAAKLHEKMISPTLKSLRNIDKRVIITPHVLKFHVDDGREQYRRLAKDIAKKYDVE